MNFNNFLKSIPQKKSDCGLILVEPIQSNITLHQLCLYAALINKAKGLKPIFLLTKEAQIKYNDLIKSYFSEYEVLTTKTIPVYMKVFYLIISFYYYLRNIIFGDLLEFKWDNTHFGDLVYDSYLINSACATNHPKSLQNLKTFYIFFKQYYIYEMAIKASKPHATLVSHRVGLNSGVLLRVGAKNKADTFSIAGQDFGTLVFTPHTEKRIIYEYSATPEDLSPILSLSNEQIETIYNKVKNKHWSGSFNADAALAFSKRNFTSRIEFGQEYKLDPKKKNIFIMLHATTDHPHSHFNGMLFNDYYDWFFQTLNHIKNIKDVNWIIKQHPSILFYPTKDVNFNTLMKNYETDNIRWLNEKSDFDSRSIMNVGDAIITCCGSAGFEFAAFNKIPCITAGDSPYTKSKFAITPRNKDEYFNALSSISQINKLTDEEHKWAMATYTFIHRLSKVKMSAVPALTHQELVDYTNDKSYFSITSKLLIENKKQVLDEFEKYVNIIQSKDFIALRTEPQILLEE